MNKFDELKRLQSEIFDSMLPLEEDKLSVLISGNRNMPRQYKYLIASEDICYLAVKTNNIRDILFYLGVEHIMSSVEQMFYILDGRDVWHVLEFYFDEDDDHLIKRALYHDT